MSRKAILAIDVGTSSVRAALFGEELDMLCSGVRQYTLNAPVPGWAEQDPQMIRDALDEAIDECLRKRGSGVEVAGICMDTALHSFVALDREGNPLTTLWTWADTRATSTLERLREGAERISLYRRTGCPLHPMYFPAKIAWLREREPQLYRRTASFASIKSFLLRHLAGRLVEDAGIASGSGLLNLESLDWDEEALALAGVERRLLPDVVEPRSVVGPLRKELAEAWGIPQVPVVAGGSDGPMANAGAGCIREGDMAITVGTSSAVRMFSSAPRTDEQGRTWCYYLGDRTWVAGGAVNAGGSTLDWLRRAFPLLAPGEGNVHARMDEMALSVPPGSDGLIAAPYLTGERNPGLQGDARGYLAGLSLRHTAAHFVRALMEGVAYQIGWVYQCVCEVAGTPERIRITGGFVDSAVWPKILAGVLGRELEVPENKEGSLVGTAAFGFSAVDPSTDWRALVGQIGVVHRIEPDPEHVSRYRELFELYQELYFAHRPHFSKIASLQRA